MEELDLRNIGKGIWKNKFIILGIILVFLVIGIIYTTYFVTPLYKSKTTLILTSNQANQISNVNMTAADININRNLVTTYSELVKSETVLLEVLNNVQIKDLDISEFRKNITVSSVKSTELIEISVSNSNSLVAKDLTAELSKVFSQKMNEIYKMDNVHIVDAPREVNTPYNINKSKDVGMFFAVGLAAATAFVVIKELFHSTVSDKKETESILSKVVLAEIPLHKQRKRKEEATDLSTQLDPKSPVAEVFRSLRTNIQFTNNKGLNKTILVTSTNPGEGKSWVCANLAITFAKNNKKVILVDTDMRKPRQYKIFNVNSNPGLSNYLSGIDDVGENVKSYLQDTNIENLKVMTAGTIPPNSSELLNSERMEELIKKLEKNCDILILDATPNIIVADALILSRFVKSTILVTAYQKTNIDKVKRVISDIEQIEGKVTGIIINKVKMSNRAYSKSYYYQESNKVKLSTKIKNALKDIKYKIKNITNKRRDKRASRKALKNKELKLIAQKSKVENKLEESSNTVKNENKKKKAKNRQKVRV